MTKTSQGDDAMQSKSGFPIFDPTAILRDWMSKMNGDSVPNTPPMVGWIEMNQHWMTFLSDRFKQDAALLGHLTTCTNPTEMAQAYTDFYKAAVGDYQSELAEIASLGQKAIGRATAADNVTAKPTKGRTG